MVKIKIGIICFFSIVVTGKAQNRFPVRMDGKWGYINSVGAVVIKPIFDNATYFYEDQGVISLNGKKGIIDTTGNYSLLKYQEILPFSEGVAVVRRNYKCGLIDKKGKRILRARYSDITSSKNGFVGVTTGYCWYMVNDKGKSVSKGPCFDYKEGYFPIYSDGLIYGLTGDSAYGYYNMSGKLVTPKIGFQFFEGIAVFHSQDFKKIGFMDTSGRVIVDPIYFSTIEIEEIPFFLFGLTSFDIGLRPGFSEGFCGVRKDNMKYIFIDKKGTQLGNAEYEMITSFHDGLAGIEVNNKWGFIDHEGKVVIEPKFDGMYLDLYSEYDFKKNLLPVGFRNGICAVTIGNKLAYINKKGEVIWQEK